MIPAAVSCKLFRASSVNMEDFRYQEIDLTAMEGPEMEGVEMEGAAMEEAEAEAGSTL